MLTQELLTNKSLLTITAGVGYAAATLLMKLAAETSTIAPLVGIAIVLAGVVAAEILLLRQVDLGLAYIAVTATETLIVLAAALVIGEHLSVREMTGGALVILGVVMVSY